MPGSPCAGILVSLSDCGARRLLPNGLADVGLLHLIRPCWISAVVHISNGFG